jgi:hypothetical protein
MNGRLYDPVLGRFLSPDPYIADPAFTQSYNRYSYVLNNPLKYNDPTGEFPWLAAGIFAAYMYLNNAYANRDQSTGKWAWNPTSWFGKGSNTTVVFGVKTNSDFTDATAFMGIGAGPSMPAFAVNSNSGVGFGVYTPQGTDFVYPGTKQRPEYSIVVQSINNAKMNYASAEFRAGFNIDKAIDYLNLHAHNTSKGACSRYVHNGLIAGGLKAAETQPVLRGGAYGPLLKDWGFTMISTTTDNYITLKGDIAVIQGYPGGTTCSSCGCPCGHIQMYNGTQWVSDFFQTRPFWPGRQYELYKPTFEIFRW